MLFVFAPPLQSVPSPASAKPPMKPATAKPETGSLQRDALLIHNQLRFYNLYVPANLRENQPVPVVFVFHGYLGSAVQVMKMTRFNALAEREGFLVVYPEVIKDRWYMMSAKSDDTEEDVLFVKAMMKDIRRRQAIDPQRLYATGFSNGGFFTQRLACELSDRLAAFASVAATIGRPMMAACHPARSVPVLMINGTRDPVVRWQGKIEKVRFAFRDSVIASVPEMAAFWQRLNACDTDAPEEELLAHLNPNRQSGTKIKRYRHCKPPGDVTLMTVYRGGHTWPGAASGGSLVPATLGRTSRDFDATEVIWQFFNKHPLPEAGL